MENSQRTIMIVDDEPNVRQSLMDFFEDLDWQVFSAESGEAALECLKTTPCSGAVVDIRMGGMDGEAFIRRASQQYPDMVFVICTGSPEFGISQDLLLRSCVADQVFGKPVEDIGELERAVVTLLSRKRQIP